MGFRVSSLPFGGSESLRKGRWKPNWDLIRVLKDSGLALNFGWGGSGLGD